MKSESNDLQQLLLASTIHEVKNQMGGLLACFDRLADEFSIPSDNFHACMLQSQAQLISHQITQVLLLYKAHSGRYSIHSEQQDIVDLFEETLIRHDFTRKLHGLDITQACDPELFGFFDSMLISNIIDTVIYNALHSGIKRIHLSGEQAGDYLAIHIEDDGPGFDETLLNQNIQQEKPARLSENKTGLGLYMAHQIAQAHRKDDLQGYVRICNGRRLPGACVSLYLP